ncbi:MAG: ATP-binding protein [Umezawaea sp.]
MDHQHDPGPPFDFFGRPPLVNGSVTAAVTVLHAEVEQALTLAVLPWEGDLRHWNDVRSVRSGIRGHLEAVVTSRVLEDVLLVAVELAANAHRHATLPGRVRVFRKGCAVRVEVTDRDPARPSTGGRGIPLVDRVSRAWGVLPDGEGGKTVWAELSEHR